MTDRRELKIKVCHVASSDMAFKFLLSRQLDFLKGQGYRVYGICSKGRWFDSIGRSGIKLKNITIKRKISPLSDAVALARMFFYFKKEKFQIVHTHTPKPGFLGQIAAKLAGVPVVINTVHGFYSRENSSVAKTTAFVFVEKISGFFSDKIFSQSKEYMRMAFEKKICARSKLDFLGNGIDLEKFNSSRFTPEFIAQKKTELGISHEAKIVGVAGRLVKEKGFLDLFEALKIICNRFSNIILIVAGPEDFEKKDAISKDIVKKYGIDEHVKFIGEREDMDEIYPLMDIFVLPSHREGLPRSLLEASAEKKPIVATNIQGCREAVDDQKTGILVPVRNPEKLAEAIAFFLLHPEEAMRMGENACLKAKKEFDENLIFEKIKNAYENLLARDN